MLKDNFKKQKLFKFKHIFADGNIIALGLFAEPFPDSAEGVKHIVLDGRYAYYFVSENPTACSASVNSLLPSK